VIDTASAQTQTRQEAISHRRLDIQGMRGLAVLLVACFHAGMPLSGGFVGVDVFFVISGFVITGLLLRRWTDSGRLDLRGFYVRRMRRLLPALAVVLCATSLASILIEPPNGQQQATAKTALAAVALAANIIIPRLNDDYFAPESSTNPLLHTWSLSAEEQFYLVFPAVLLIGLALTRSRSGTLAPMLIIGGLSAGSLTVLVWTASSPVPEGWLKLVLHPFYSSITRAWEFGAGAVVALAAAPLGRCNPAIVGWGGVAGFAAVACAALSIPTPMTGPALVFPVAGTMLMLAAGLQPLSLVARALSSRPLVALGDLSYSWYLWHWPAIVFGRLLAPATGWMPVACAAASLAPAFLSYRFVENPIRFSARLHGRSLAGWLTAAAALPILFAGTLGFGARLGWGQDWALGSHSVLRRGCEAGDFDPVRCRWSVPAAQGTILLLGDSQSWAIADGLIPAAADLGLETIVASQNGCPFLSPPTAPGQPPPLKPWCRVRNAEVLRFATTHPVRIAVIANRSLEYPSLSEAAWRAGFSAVIRALRSSGAGVVLISPTPLADEQSRRLSLLGKSSPDRFTALDHHRDLHRHTKELERRIADENSGTIVFDPATVLCDDRRCAVARDGIQLYSDRNHLSRSGALLLQDGLREALARAVSVSGATAAVK
jgi:peptidoglycan/LPS O-acetylase OafA/YrhL